MLLLVAGLAIFLGAHSLRIFAEDWRNRQIARRGEQTWKGLVSICSLIGFILIVWGYGEARTDSAILWQPPSWTRHLAAALALPALIFLVAAYLPGTKIKAMVGHPMILGVKLWAFGHLLASDRWPDLLLFGAFLLWAIMDFRTSRRRDKASGTGYPMIGLRRDLIAVVVGTLVWGAFAFALHEWLIGVAPFA